MISKSTHNSHYQRSTQRLLQLLLVTLFLFSGSCLALSTSNLPFLPQEQAYQGSSLTADAGMLHLRWEIADGHYLYRDKFVFESHTPGITLGTPLFPAGSYKVDESFGRMLIYRHQVTIDIPYKQDPSVTQPIESIRLKTVSQGCADRGLCYAPHTQFFSIRLAKAGLLSNQAHAFDSTDLSNIPETSIKPSTEESWGQSLKRSLSNNFSLKKLFKQQTNTFLPVDQAYILSVDIRDPHTLNLHWDIADGYYLYRKNISARVLSPAGLQLGALQFLPGKIKEDEYFGRMEVYYAHTDVGLPLLRTASTALPVTISVTYQGCADAGLCYPPVTKNISIDLPPLDVSRAGQNNAASGIIRPSEQDKIAQLLASDQALLTALSLFGIGLLLAFTPCVLPMIPILSSIIVGQGKNVSTRRAFTISLVYVLAMALTYTLAGVFAGLFGQNLQVAFQSPWIIILFSLTFVGLSLSMFGFYELQLPASLQNRLNKFSNRPQQNTYLGVAVMGVLSALIVGPCVAAPLAGVLIYIGLSGDAWMGGFSLFMMSLGMGLPLLIIGTSAGKLLPRVGPWMNSVKAVFGVILLAMAVWMLERILPGPVSLLLWALLFFGSAVFMGAVSRLDADASNWQKLLKTAGLVFLLYGGILIVGAASGNHDIFEPLKNLRAGSSSGAAHANFKPIKGPAGLQAALLAARQGNKTVMLDFYADWCVDCKKLEKATFTDPSVLMALSRIQLLQADVTANDAEDKALMRQFGLYGPPAILFFDRQGNEIKHRRLIGFLQPDEFLTHLQNTY